MRLNHANIIQSKTHHHTLSCPEDGSVPMPPLDLNDDAPVMEVHIELVSHWCLARLLSLCSLFACDFLGHRVPWHQWVSR